LTDSNDYVQRLDEWDTLDEASYRYHRNQWEYPKQSTLAFAHFIDEKLRKAPTIIDMGAGAGASTAVLASKYSSAEFLAFEYSHELVRLGSRICSEKELKNLTFLQGDWFDYNETRTFDGCISLQTLSWLPDYRRPLEIVFRKIQPTWFGCTSLFYEGDISCRIEVEEHRRKRKSFYNVYSIPAIARMCAEYGYQLVKAEPFVIDIDLAKPNELDVMGTYTRRLVSEDDSGDRIQISGPLLMNWYMLLIEKTKSVN
jgi:ubiquinone/menaquinone biosynthesis C-methylase UbiE